MELLYNGVSLELLQLDRIERHNVYDPSGLDLMYIKWTISATCMYSAGGRPVGTAVKSVSQDTLKTLLNTTNPPSGRPVRGDDPDTPTGVDQEHNVVGNKSGYNAMITDVELRTRLCLPRKPFIIRAFRTDGGGFHTWIQSPKEGYACDPIGGPKPLGPPDVLDITGDGTTFGVHFQLETATLPNPDGSDQLILSHRWQMTHSHDENYYTLRHVEGEAVFNLALLFAKEMEPDWFRNQLFHPIPLGFKREDIVVKLSPDNSTLHYSFTDRDTPIIFDAGDSGATNISIVEQVRIDAPTAVRVFGG